MKGLLPAPGTGPSKPLTAAIIAADTGLLNEIRVCLSGLGVHIGLEQASVDAQREIRLRLQSARPDFVIFEMALEPEPAQAAIRELKFALPDCPVVAVGRATDAESLLAALRAGCSDYVFPPLGTNLAPALARISQALSADNKPRAARPAGAVLGVLSAKGGCGGTTLACHVARDLRTLVDGKVLLTDLDLVGGNIAFTMKSQTRRSVADAVMNLHRMDMSYFGALVSENCGVDVLPAPGPALLGSELPPESVATVLSFVRSEYRVTIADLGAGLNPVTDRALDEMDSVLVVTMPDVHAIHQARALVTYLTESRTPRVDARVVVNRLPKKGRVGAIDDLLASLPVCGGVCSDYQALYDAAIEGQLVSPKTAVGRDFTNLAKMIAGVDGGNNGERVASPVRLGWIRATSYFF